MTPSLQPAGETDRAFCESLHRTSMSVYLTARAMPWDRNRFAASWAEFDNFLIVLGSRPVGLIRLLAFPDALEIRDLQVLPEHRGLGIGAWAVLQAQAQAADRRLGAVRLRVYEENPARALYARLGFRVDETVAGTVHMSCAVPPTGSLHPTPPRASA